MTQQQYMQLAIDTAKSGKTPFGAVVINEVGEYFARFNTTSTDGPMAHAEINALKACRNSSPITLYSTAEPCVMCMGSILWHKVKTVYFGVDISQIKKYMPQIDVPAEHLARNSFTHCELHSGLLSEECEALFEDYA